MKEYPKIQSIFKRDERTHKFIENDFSLPEFEYLASNQWVWTEKIDGTNVRVGWDAESKQISFGGKTDNAQMPPFLLKKLQDTFTIDKFVQSALPTLCLYCEGYGAKIQKGGKYIPDGVDAILFDILIDSWWLRRDGIEDIASKLGLKVVPIVGQGTIYNAISAIKTGVKSTFGDFQAEGMVLKPVIELFSRKGERIITKIKHVDF